MVFIMLARTKNAIEECQKHLKDTEASGTIIESYLTQHLLVLLSADMQQAIYECLDKKAENVDPESIRLFLSSAGRSLVRGVKKSAIAGFVKYFGKDAKQKFDDCLKNKEQEVTHYGNAIENRDSVAHKQGVQVTFSEIKQAVHAAEIILSAVTKALEIPSPPRPAGGRGH
jgi:hypothetical protein